MPNYTIYTDGHSSPHLKNRAGWAILIEVEDGCTLASYTGKLEPDATNNETELMAITIGLRHCIALNQAINRKSKEDSITGYKWSPTTLCPINSQSTHSINPTPITIHSDSALAIDLVLGHKFTKKEWLRHKVVEAKVLWVQAQFPKITWVPRASNKAGLLIEKMNRKPIKPSKAELKMIKESQEDIKAGRIVEWEP